MTQLSDAHNKWLETCSEAGHNKDNYERDCFIYDNFILKYYNDSDRHYHNLNHIMQCLGQFNTMEIEASCPEEIMLALWFHDIIYDPRKLDNESKSADLAELCLSYCKISIKAISRITNMILFSGQHLDNIGSLSEDQKIFLDIDLSILGQASNIYDEYSQNVRKEYSFIDDDIFYVKRKEILESFLKKKNIYYTQYFRETIGDQAIKNIKREIRSIKI